MDERYIDVTGSAQALEAVAEQRVVLTLSTQASRTESAFGKGPSMEKASQLRDTVIRTLRENGLQGDELKEGGRETWQPWYQRKSTGQEANYRILIQCDDTQRLYRALDALQPLFDGNSRHTLDMSMLEPRYDVPPEQLAQARAAAIHDARHQAQMLAEAAGAQLGAVLRIEEQGAWAESSGAYGDTPTRMSLDTLSASADSTPAFEPLDGAVRRRHLRYRVRFALGAAG